MRVITLLTLFAGTVCLGACSGSRTDKYAVSDKDGNHYFVKTMPDGNDWITENLRVNVPESFCYDGLQNNCGRYGRLYTWKTAMNVCGELGTGWQLPTSDEWRALAKHYGGVYNESNDEGKAAYQALMAGGSSQFNALLGGGTDRNEGYKRIDAHGFYWTATSASDSMAWFGNFGKGRPAFFLQNDGEKYRGFSVRCVRKR